MGHTLFGINFIAIVHEITLEIEANWIAIQANLRITLRYKKLTDVATGK